MLVHSSFWERQGCSGFQVQVADFAYSVSDLKSNGNDVFHVSKNHHFHIVRYSDLLIYLAAAYHTIIYKLSLKLLSHVLLLWKRRYNMPQWELQIIPKYSYIVISHAHSSPRASFPSAPSLRYILWRRGDYLRVVHETEGSYRLATAQLKGGFISDAEGIFEWHEPSCLWLRTFAVAPSESSTCFIA